MGAGVEPKRSLLKVGGVVALYWSISISMVFIMKHLLSGNYGNQDLTIFVTWFQCAVVVAMILFLKLVSKVLRIGKIPSLDSEAVLNSDMLSLSFTFVISLTMNNLMLKHIGVSFYQVARSLTLIFSILLSVCMLLKAPGLRVLLSCLFIIIGFVVSVDQEEASGTINIWGVMYGILASFTSALSGIYFKRGETAANGSALKLAYINNFNSMLIVCPLVFSTNQFSHIVNASVVSDLQMWLFLTVSGVLSLAIGWASALQIRYTSPVTHQISINAKSITQTVIAILWHQEQKTGAWWCGNLLVLLGIGLYTYSKLTEKPPPALEQTSSRNHNEPSLKTQNNSV